ncbi:Mu transposase C-terminal domain-containing protein [Zobellella aerophila]|uniref:Mu transposase C-terminal domain-containing protein n=1 Tax=Zobellella aerophila TaxID=870480 RepID=A0ABP6V7Q1_9GAMM
MTTNSSGRGFFTDEFEYADDEVIQEADSSPADPVTVPRDLASYPEETRNEVQRRIGYINWVRKRLDGGWTKAKLDPLIQQASVEIEGYPPNWRTLVRWWKLYSSSGYELASLIPKHGGKGNRKSKADANAEVFLDRAIERYLVKERPSIAKVYRYYADSIRLANQHLEGERIKALSYYGFYNRVKELPPYEVAVARYGKFIADQKFNAIGAHIPPERILEKVEIDHTALDLILLDDKLLIPLGRPCLTLLVDCYSHCIIGFYIGFEGASYDSVRKALLHSIKPKTYVHDRYPCIEHDWPCYGKPEILVVDNGAEFWSESLELVCLEMGINIQPNKRRTPWHKPLVERNFGIVNNMLLDDIPGKTFSDILTKAGYNPEKDAIMRFSTFIEHFHQWVIDKYHNSADSRKRYIPALLWNKGFQSLPPAKISGEDLKKLEVIIGLSAYRKLRRGGIHIHCLRYDSEELSHYRKNNSPKDSVLVKTNTDDLSSVHVYLKGMDGYLQVPCIDPVGYTKGLTLQQHQINLRLHRNYIDDALDLDSLARVGKLMNERIEREIEELSNFKNKSRSQKGMSRLARHQQVGSGENGSVVPQQELLPLKSEQDTDKQLEDWDDYVDDLDGY